jgi:hypothetical protein
MKVLLTTILLLCSAFTVAAQNYRYPYGDEVTFDQMASTPPTQRSVSDLREFLNILRGPNMTKAALYAAGKSGYESLLNAAEQARMDKQTGSTPSSSGTTSLVSKGVVPQVLGFAVENGALTETDNSTTATFRGTGIGVARLLAGAQQFPYCAIVDYSCESGIVRALDGASFSLTFNTSQNAPASSTGNTSSNASLFSGTANQIAGWSARYDFHVRRKLSDAGYRTSWEAAIQNLGADQTATAYLTSVEAAFGKIRTTPEYENWLQKYVQQLRDPQSASEDSFKRVLARAVESLVEIARSQDSKFDSAARNLLTSLGGYLGTRDKALNAVVNRVTYSFEYDDNRPSNQPTQSVGKFILSGRPDSGEKWQITFNSSISWYDQAPPQSAVKRLRYGQAALQVDRALMKPAATIGVALGGGYYFQYMADNSLLTLPNSALAPGTSIPLAGNASALLNTKGAVHLGQAQVTFSIKGTGIKIPLALSVSNRTELIKASNVVGHFGITYDLDSLFTKK